jgi:hypothetical protein
MSIADGDSTDISFDAELALEFMADVVVVPSSLRLFEPSVGNSLATCVSNNDKNRL